MITENDTYRSYVNKIEEIYNNWEKATGENTIVSLSPVRKGKMTLDLKGNTEQNGTPTPSSPVNVEVVTGENKVVVSNKNLLNLDKSEVGAIDSSGNLVSNKQNWRATDFIPVSPNTTYTYSRSDTNVSTTLRLYEYDKDFSFISPRTEATTATNTITTKSNTRYLKWVVYQNKTMTIDIIESLNLQIELGDQRTDYIQHQEQSFSISLGSLELCKIGDYQDYIYRQNGTWYLHKEVGKVVLNGTESWQYTSNTLVNTQLSGYLKTIDFITCLSNYYTAVTQVAGAVNLTGDNVITLSYHSVNNRIFIKDGRFDNKDDFETWLSSNNVTLYYVLAEATDTEITNTTLVNQLEDLYNNAKSYDTTTNITQENANLPFIINASALKKGGN